MRRDPAGASRRAPPHHDRIRCAQCARRFTGLNLGVNLALALLKVAVAFLAGSRALLAGALYSINDVLSALVVMVSLRFGKEPADAKHPYGHDKLEFIAVAAVGVFLVTGVTFILFYSLADILRGIEGPPHAIAVLVALLTLGANLFLYKQGECVAEHTGSLALRTSAEHNRADAVSSVAVLIGVGGATLGWHVLDPLCAVFETIHIVWLCGSLFGQSIRGLMDSSVDPDSIQLISRACAEVPGVLRVERLRTRKAGAVHWVDAEVAVDPALRVEEAHGISEAVRRALVKALGGAVEAHVRFRAPTGAPGPGPMERAVGHHA
ncbi:MAG: cation diffusion facilitator family transporter [Deferrisomatales bacterium]